MSSRIEEMSIKLFSAMFDPKCDPHTIHVIMIYLPTWKPWKSTIHVGKYTSSSHGWYGWMSGLRQKAVTQELGERMTDEDSRYSKPRRAVRRRKASSLGKRQRRMATVSSKTT